MDIIFCKRALILITLNLTAEVSSRENRCYGNHCSEDRYGNMKAVCKNGFCYCTGKDYDYDSCLPDAYGCKIVSNSDATLNYPVYTCTPYNSSPLYEVHVLGVYEVISRRPPTAGDANVIIISREKSNRPIVLVLGSYEPVHWILNIPNNILISKVILVSYYIDKSSVAGDLSRVKSVERKGTRDSDWDSGYGSDSGGGGTVEMLRQIDQRFGVVTSFKGSYIAKTWSVELSHFKGNTNVAYCGYAGCKNGGSCIAPFVCRCTPEWTGDKCENEAISERLYYLFFISVPLIIGLGFMADKYLKQRDRRMAQHNQPFPNQNAINLNQQNG